jgi:hypothetical protein
VWGHLVGRDVEGFDYLVGDEVVPGVADAQHACRREH